MDHVNSHHKFAERAVSLGYVVIVVRHRPAEVNLEGILLQFAFLLVFRGFACISSSLISLALVALAVILFNYMRCAVPLASVVHDCAAAIAFVYHELDCARFGADRDKLVTCGASSGGHLFLHIALGVARFPLRTRVLSYGSTPAHALSSAHMRGNHSLMLAHSDRSWLRRLAVPEASLVAVVDVSGVASLDDLPLRWVFLPPLLGLDPAAWRALSPARGATAQQSCKPTGSCFPYA